MAGKLSYCAEEVRRQDWERFLCALFAPAAARESLFALLAFNQEIAKTREVVTEPLLGEMRLQWWRDALDRVYEAQVGQAEPPVTGHQVLDALTQAIGRHRLSRPYFDELIDGRSRDLDPEPMPNLAALTSYAEATSGKLNLLMMEILGLPDVAMSDTSRVKLQDAANDLGIGWAMIGQLRILPRRLGTGVGYLPADQLSRAGLNPNGGWGVESVDAAIGPVTAVAELAAEHLERAREAAPKVDRRFLSVMLPAVLGGQYLKRLARAGHNVFDSGLECGRLQRQIKVAISALRGAY